MMSLFIKKIYKLGKNELFPICRSITGNGVRKTLKIIKRHFSQLRIYEIQSGTKVFDWNIPAEWNAKNYELNETQIKLFGIDKLNIKRSKIPAVTHVDYSARVQTVHRDTNPKYHSLISRFKETTGCPILVNTIFNHT